MYTRYVSLVYYVPAPLQPPRRFDRTIDSFSDSDCYIFFRFTKAHLHDLHHLLRLNDDELEVELTTESRCQQKRYCCEHFTSLWVVRQSIRLQWMCSEETSPLKVGRLFGSLTACLRSMVLQVEQKCSLLLQFCAICTQATMAVRHQDILICLLFLPSSTIDMLISFPCKCTIAVCCPSYPAALSAMLSLLN